MKIKKTFQQIKVNIKIRSILVLVLCCVMIIVGLGIVKKPKQGVSCKKILAQQIDKYNSVVITNKGINEIYNELNKHEQKCRYEKSDIINSIKYVHLQMVTLYLKGDKKDAKLLANSSIDWIDSNLSKDQSTQPVFSEYIELIDMREGINPSSAHEKNQQLNSKN